ncbi:unnamed protein product [Strongylus vulgaris]|uniref:Cytochrome P450 n=1 Tax=Strongylus vulgaris TaxID=40348 RepID=A0A3P7JG86_STRVU|nr:unnamed protein product [Strongylus vulgaris]
MKRCASSAASTITSSSTCPVAGAPASSTTIRSFEEIPGPSTISRILGKNRSLIRSKKSIAHYYDWLVDLHKCYGPIVKVNQGFGRGYVVHVFDPEDARQVFASDGRQPFIVPLQETTQRYREMKGMNPGLGNLNGDEWYRLRSSIQQVMMRPQAVQNYQPSRSIAKDEEQDSACNFFIVQKDINSRLRFAFPFYKYFSTPKWKKMVKLEDKFYREANLLIEEAIQKLRGTSQTEEEMKFASLLINRKELNDKDVAIILLSMFSDGLSTTAPMLIYNLFNIASNREAQDKLRQEVNTAVDRDKEAQDKLRQEVNIAVDRNKEITPTVLSHLPFLRACIKETFRLFPIGTEISRIPQKDLVLSEITPTVLSHLPFLRACIKETFRLFPIGTEISRIPQKDLVLSGYRVPTCTPVDVNTNVLMKSKALFEDPLSFQPTRWLRDSTARHDFHPFSFLPFGFGPRMCAGRRFAEQDLLVVLCRLVQNFRISHRHSPIEQIYETLLLPKGCCDFHFEQL